MKMGYLEHTARNIICEAKSIMVQQGYPFYNNKRLGRVPVSVVESIIGITFSLNESDTNKDD